MHSIGSGVQMSSQIGTPMRTPEKTSGPGCGPRAKHALLVEHAVVRQVDLEPHRFDPSAGEQRRGVVERAVLDPRQADQHRRAAVGGLARQRLAGAAAGLLERRLEHEVFRRIAGEIELRRHDEPGAESGGFGARFAQPFQIAVDVADDRGNLRERDDEAIGGSGHGRRFCALARATRKPVAQPFPRSGEGGAKRRMRGRAVRRRRDSAESMTRGPLHPCPSPSGRGLTPPPATGRAGAARRSVLTSSATRKAISIACSALSRGSQ